VNSPGSGLAPLTSPWSDDGLAPVSIEDAEFEGLVAAIVVRFVAQQRQPDPPADEVRRFAAQLRQSIAERDVRPMNSDGDDSSANRIDESECTQLAERALAGTTAASLAEAARQLVKACFSPELHLCRDSFREVTKDGACRRQDLGRAQGRISGSHCVDCPHWITLRPNEHEEYLRQQWCGDPQVFVAHRSVFLPEDFRALRIWLRDRRR
jgi:hypothetical protein